LLTESLKPGAKVINVYVGVPNRVKKLIEVGTVNVKGSHLKHLIIDTRLNPKNLSIFDVLETRDDSLDLLLLAQKRLIKRKTTVTLV